jgi:hypothetical protein
MPHEPTTNSPPTLADLQSQFQAAIVGGSNDVLALIPPNSRTGNDVLFGVYRFAYSARLVEVIRNAYPMLAKYMGGEAFHRLAERYVVQYPSRHTNARWYSVDVPDLLAEAEYSTLPVLREIALLERQLDQAFDAPDASVLDLAALAQHPPETWSALVFTPHPSVAMLTFRTNAFEVWVALKNDQAVPEAVVLDLPQSLLVWRWGTVPNVRKVEAEERMLWIEAGRGKPFGGLAEMAAIYDTPEEAALRVAQYLNGWLSSDMLSEAMTTEVERVRV